MFSKGKGGDFHTGWHMRLPKLAQRGADKEKMLLGNKDNSETELDWSTRKTVASLYIKQ